jgi:ubiquitin-activating enzyme E1
VSFEDCIKWARTRFEDYFSNRVKQLTFTFPENAITNTGSPFWSAPKRFPKPLEFTSTDPGQLSFVAAGAILCAETYGISIPNWAWDAKKLSEAVDSIKLAKFVPKEGVRIETDEKATNMNSISIDDESEIEQLIGTLEEGVKDLPTAFHMNPIQFEKDDDTNYHMDFIAGLANMRARTYSIPEVDKLKAKFIAGRIIPAIATTTAMTTGLICLELYKVLLGHSVEQYRNTFVNLALPLFSMAEPVAPKLLQHLNLKWSIWDRWVIRGDLTLRELIAWFDERGLTAYSVVSPSYITTSLQNIRSELTKKFLT